MNFNFNNEILCNNYRISRLILKHNKREDYPIVDNKIQTAIVAKKYSIPTPENYFFIESHGELKHKVPMLKSLTHGFVVKPAEGSQGGGILIINRITKDGKFDTGRLGTLSDPEFKHYLSGILSGLYSLKGHRDQILIQEKIVNIPEFEKVTTSGIPDVRIIVLLGFPIMAMIRFPTISSGGRGNLHLGAIGCGINLKTGVIYHSIQNNRSILNHPDTSVDLSGLKIPYWNDLLNLASKCSEMARIGYLGVDLVIDKNKGPLLLEMNARPGLSIQLANQKGLLPLIKKVLKDSPLKQDSSHQSRTAWSLNHLT
jgi:alpha-L-glutamate ligase-like protein